MADEFLDFNNGKIHLDDFPFNLNNNDVSSTIPENELLDFSTSNPNNNNINNSRPTHSISHLNPNQISQQNSSQGHGFDDSYNNNNNSYLSPIASPYTNPNQLSSSFVSSRKNSIYDTLESVASPQQSNSQQYSLNAQYFSPAQKPISFNNQGNSYNQARNIPDISSINSPGSYNDQLSPYPSSFETFKSPSIRSQGLSPATGSSLPKSQLTKEDKLKRRREFHNQVERRRRDLIKERIKELGVIVPPSLLLVDSDGKEIKPSKSVIINKTVEYVEHLHKVMKYQEERLDDLLKKINEFEQLPDQNPDQNPVPQQQQHQQENLHNFEAQRSSELSNSDSYQNSPANYNEHAPQFSEKDLDFDVNEFLREHKGDANWDDLNNI
ncbi:Upstream stimulatory factor 1 [Wickerhamomyces ciferrii]|uniref:Upstream stimulatory factor 1 n=1 Tax=Wickerhamomyces ciferrii (strain ATCC 14091 / BCRC 22168 / CBS 111 / JCM 3599 / NBRC 0793 / NRRL Y-1031 F-60-10) TaxID=1206466 RepID=K0KV88_WICCF|nr:Upstream stimulatory factor 1 [Wickerhamomyces ciferrii]CCH45349.1 Upstream stimulatory factor 1 [Wickerhamomyces ciferrii]